MAKHLNRAAPSSTTSNISDQALTPDEPRVSTKSAGTARSALPATADSSAARPTRRLPAYRTWVPALLIWILSCAVHFGIFALSLSRDLQHPMSKVNRNLDYLSYLNIWDALFYERIYKHGYPQELPFLPDGTVNHNTWAFMPMQSVLSGGVSNVFGIDYRLASVLVTLVAGCALSLVLYRLFVGSLNWSARGVFDARPQAGDESRNRLALWALAVYALSPASPIFVTGYAEALSTLFLALCAWCVVRNRYLLLLPVALCAALSRPVGVPLGAFVALVYGCRLPRPHRRHPAAIALGCVGCVPRPPRPASERPGGVLLRLRASPARRPPHRTPRCVPRDGTGMERSQA